jgi:hypothetical protein
VSSVLAGWGFTLLERTGIATPSLARNFPRMIQVKLTSCFPTALYVMNEKAGQRRTLLRG